MRVSMRRGIFTIGSILVAVLVVSMVVSCSPKAPRDATPTRAPETNDRTGDRVVFFQDYSSIGAVPGNICLAANSEPYVTANSTLSYSATDKAIRLDVTQGPVGNLIVSGLSPSLSTSLSLDMKMGRTNFNAEVNIRAANAWLLVSIRDGSPSDTLRIRSYYYGPKLAFVQSESPNIGTDNAGRFKITIVSNSAERTNTIYLNGVQKLTTPILWSASDFSPASYDPFMNPSIYFYWTLVTPGNSAYVELKSITQTIPQYRYITPISNPRIIPFGIDGPHAYEYVRDGLALMAAKGQRGTIWADPVYVAEYSAEDLDSLRRLIANGWELGIHFYERLEQLSWNDATALMDEEFHLISTKFGTPPTSWCSLGNADNSTHADYAFRQFGMVWRNGKNGVEILSNVGNLEDANWDFWSRVSAAGAVFPTFTHRLDSAPAIKFSISPDKFSKFVQNFMSNGVQIVGYREYWDSAQNSYHTTISNLRFDNGVLRGFTINNIGGNSRLLISTSSVKEVRDSRGQTVPFEKADGGIIVQVTAGEYVLDGNSPF
jgi:hypothetical protein